MFKIIFIFSAFLPCSTCLTILNAMHPLPRNITLNCNLRHFNYAAPINFTTTANQIEI